ncbi:hypothetical protein QNK06_11015 [Bacillus subtilis]|uniref:hypothetical protein n=1 Tax=Bacillus subtilis TaxID=1423 RepID=UPI0024C2096D|nr:hypothetical protein [Bacillus subtilis]WHY07532.1 hypothetical protein QNK06_11015 [Bacillus subtilis]WPP23707.1 hypothetical protein SIS06_11360 [Bacillus subtilis]
MDTEQIKQKLLEQLISKSFSDHEDDVTRRTNAVGIKTCKGDERWVEGTISTPSVDVSLENENDPFNLAIICDLTIPYSANYKRKDFYGIGCEYGEEHKDPRGTMKCTFKFTFGGHSLENIDNENPDPSRAHDSTRMCEEAIIDVLQHLNIR